MSNAIQAATIDPRILDEAADWLVQLHASGVTEMDRAACERWRQTSPEHARAWACAELLINKLGALPPALALPVLNRQPAIGRRAVLAKLALLAGAAPAGWLAWRAAPADWRLWRADHHTATGERRDLQLADGSRITLNTASAIDVRFDEQQRFIDLRAGEILVQTAPDTAAHHRPFRVGSGEGRMEALGTRFTVRQYENHTHLAVLEGSVRAQPAAAGATAQILRAGQQADFTGRAVGAVLPASEAVAAWTHGMLMADDTPLAEFAAELARYHQGIVHCDPAIANLRVSGAFPVARADRALAMLVATYPVRAVARLRGYWITLVPR